MTISYSIFDLEKVIILNDRFKKFLICILILFNIFFIFNYGVYSSSKRLNLEDENSKLLKKINSYEENNLRIDAPYKSDKEFLNNLDGICSISKIDNYNIEFVDFKKDNESIVSEFRLDAKSDYRGLNSLIENIDAEHRIRIVSVDVNILDDDSISFQVDLSIVSDFEELYMSEEGLYNKDYFPENSANTDMKEKTSLEKNGTEKKEEKNNLKGMVKKEQIPTGDRTINNSYNLGDIKFINQEYENIENIDDNLILFYFSSANKEAKRKYITKKIPISIEGEGLIEFWVNSSIDNFSLGLELERNDGTELNKFPEGSKNKSGWNYYSLKVDGKEVKNSRVFIDIVNIGSGSVILKDFYVREMTDNE